MSRAFLDMPQDSLRSLTREEVLFKVSETLLENIVSDLSRRGNNGHERYRITESPKRYWLQFRDEQCRTSPRIILDVLKDDILEYLEKRGMIEYYSPPHSNNRGIRLTFDYHPKAIEALREYLDQLNSQK